MWKHFLCIMSMLLTLTAWGCSLAPQPVARPVTGQQTLEAADHWRILAQQIVKEMQLTTGSSVYVSEQDRSPFGRAFTTLLRHEVAASGARLSGAREGSLCIGVFRSLSIVNPGRPFMFTRGPSPRLREAESALATLSRTGRVHGRLLVPREPGF